MNSKEEKMNAIRRLLKSRSGFTLVELMVVVVVLGILAGIAVQRMGDVRDRAEEAALAANTRLLLGAANLAIARNYGDYMYSWYNTLANDPDNLMGEHNSTIRWVRPCDGGPAVTQIMGSLSRATAWGHGAWEQNNYISGYSTFADVVPNADGGHAAWNVQQNFYYNWRQGQEWNLNDYLESFPVGFAVEIVFAARDADGNIRDINYGDGIDRGNAVPYRRGYHKDRNSIENNPYDKDIIYIYKFTGDKLDDSAWGNFNTPLLPTGIGGSFGGHDGHHYPYHFGIGGVSGVNLSPEDGEPSHWKLVFPKEDS